MAISSSTPALGKNGQTIYRIHKQSNNKGIKNSRKAGIASDVATFQIKQQRIY